MWSEKAARRPYTTALWAAGFTAAVGTAVLLFPGTQHIVMKMAPERLMGGAASFMVILSALLCVIHGSYSAFLTRRGVRKSRAFYIWDVGALVSMAAFFHLLHRLSAPSEYASAYYASLLPLLLGAAVTVVFLFRQPRDRGC